MGSTRTAFSLPDLCDAHPDVVRVAQPLFRGFGGIAAFGGPIRTIKCFEDSNDSVSSRF